MVVEKEEILKEIETIQSNKDIPCKLIKDNADIFSEFVLTASIMALNSLLSHRD